DGSARRRRETTRASSRRRLCALCILSAACRTAHPALRSPHAALSMIAFVFPGQGAQKVGMGKTLADAFPICRETFDEADAALGESLSTLCFEGPDDKLMLTENTQPAILAMSTAVARLAVSQGIRPSFAAGHSLGEYSAHVAAGTLSFADALRTVRRRGRY